MSTLPTRVIDGQTHGLELLFADPFANFDHWTTFATTSTWEARDGALEGHWRPEGGGSNVWCREDFSGDLYLVCKARLYSPDPQWIYPNMPEGGKNINVRFLVQGPEGQDILSVAEALAATGTGPNRVGDDQYRGYFFTWTFRHGRLRRSPGYDNVSENLEILPQIETEHTIEVLKIGPRLRFICDGRKAHDYIDPQPFDSGKIGFALWCSRVRIWDLAVYRPVPM